MMDFAKEFHDYGTENIQFPELAKIWEDNKFEVIIEPSALYWTEMVEHWPKTRFIHLTRDFDSWKKSLQAFVGTLADMPKDWIKTGSSPLCKSNDKSDSSFCAHYLHERKG